MSPTSYNICIISPANYPHSRAFFEIAEALIYSLSELGHPIQLQLNSIHSQARNIIIGAHMLDAQNLTAFPPNTIILNTEQLSGIDSDWFGKLEDCFRAGFEIWEYSEANVEMISRMGGNRIKLFKFGYQPQLNRIKHAEQPDVDVLFYGSVNERRRDVLQDMQKRGLNTQVLTGVYGKDRDAWIARSKVVLNMHFYSSQIFEVVRVFYLLTNGVAVVGEVNPATTIDERFARGIAAAPFEKLADTAVELVRDPQKLAKQREAALASIMPYPQVDFTRLLVQD